MTTIQFSVSARNAALAGIETTVGTSPKLRLFSGSRPANCAAASTGTMLVEMSLPSDWLEAPSDGTVLKKGTWSGTAGAAGTVGYYRIFDTAGTTCHEQGTVSQAVTLTTSAATSAFGNLLTFTDTTGAAMLQGVSGVGIPDGAQVVLLNSTQIGISLASGAAGIASGATIQVGDVTGNLQLNNTSLTIGQTVTIDYKAITCPGN
jgi:hypothetical protein